MASITACIFTRNHAWSIRRALRSAFSITNHVLVCDFGSTDETAYLAKNLGSGFLALDPSVRVTTREAWEEACPSDWVLLLSGNEEITGPLQTEVGYVFRSELQGLYRVYGSKVVTMGRHDFVRRPLAYEQKSIRLYNKSELGQEHCFFSEGDPSGSLPMEIGGFGEDAYFFEGAILSRSGISLEHLVDEANFSSTRLALMGCRAQHSPSIYGIFSSCFRTFFRTYFRRRYCIFGFAGVVDALIIALREFLKLVKIRESALRKKG